MSTRDDVLKKAKQNRTNRVQKIANQYKGGKLSKSHYAYINGNFKKTASMREYGYKKADDFKGVTYYTGGRSRNNYEKLQNGYNPYQVRYLQSNYQARHYVPPGKSKATGRPYDGFYSNKILLNKNQLNAVNAYGKLTPSTLRKAKKTKENVDSYAILRPYSANPRNFGETLNTRTLDGLRVARNKVRKGGSRLNYLGGLAKDFVLDPAVDLLKTFDRYESSALNAGLGVAHTATELADALTKKSTKLSDVKWNRAVDNWKHSINTSNKTGWGDSSGESIKKIVKGTQQRQLKEYQNGGNSLTDWWESKFTGKSVDTKKRAKEYEKKINSKKTKQLDDLGSTISGLFLDIANPVQIGSKVMGGSAKLLKKNLKDLRKGNKSVGLVSDPEGMEWLNKITKQVTDKYRKMKKPKKSYVDDILHETEQQNKARKSLSIIDDDIPYSVKRQAKDLDNDFIRNMQKVDNIKPVKQVIDNNPKTNNLSQFLDDIDSSNSKQMNLWRRIRKNKRMTKDGYIPNAINRVDDVVEGVTPNAQIKGQQTIDDLLKQPKQLDMFDQLNVPKRDFTPNPPKHTPYQEVKEPTSFQQTIDDIIKYDDQKQIANVYKKLDELDPSGEELFRYIDELDDVEFENMMDYLERFEPELYQKYTGIDDFMDEVIVDNVAKKEQQATQAKKLQEEMEQITKNSNQVDDLERAINKSVIDNEYFRRANELGNEKYKDVMQYSTDVKNAGGFMKTKLYSFAKRIDDGKVNLNAVKALTNRLRKADIPVAEKVNYINNNLFGGQKILLENATTKTINQFFDSLDDIYKVLENNRDIRNGVVGNDSVVSSLSKSTQDFLESIQKQKKYTELPPVNSDAFLGDLIESINRRKGSITDPNYWDKMQYLSNRYGYKNKSDITNKIKELRNTIKQYDKLPQTKEVIAKKTEMNAEVKRLKQMLELRDAEKKNIMNLGKEWDDYVVKLLDDKSLSDSETRGIKNYLENKRLGKEPERFGMKDYEYDVERDIRELNEELADEARYNSNKKSSKKEYLQKAHYKSIEQQKKLTPGLYNEYVNKVAELDKYYDDLRFANRQGVIERTNSKFLQVEDPDYVRQIQNELKALEDTPEIIKKFGLNEPKYKVKSVKYHKSVNRGKLPEVQDNLGELKHLLEQEADMAVKSPSEYKKYGESILAIKRDYINAIRSYGVDTKLIKNNANAYLKDIVNAEKNPVKKMNLQMLAKKISNDIDNAFKETNFFSDVKVKNFSEYTKKQKDILYSLPMSDVGHEAVLDNRLKRYWRTNVKTKSTEGSKVLRPKDTSGKIKDYSIWDVIRDGNKNVIDKATGEVHYNAFNRNQLKSELKKDKEISKVLKYYSWNNKKDDKIIEFLNDVERNMNEGKSLTTMELSSFLDSIGIDHDITDAKSLKKAMEKFKYILEKRVEQGHIKPNNLAEDLILSRNPRYVPEINAPKVNPSYADKYEKIEKNINLVTPEDVKINDAKRAKEALKPRSEETKKLFDDLSKPLNKSPKPKTPLDNVSKPKREVTKVETPLDNVSKPKNKSTKPETPLDKINKPKTEPVKPSKPKAEPSKPKVEPNKPNSESTTNKQTKESLFNLYKRYLNTYKKGVTVYNPGWHLQNYLQNKGQNYLALGLDAFAPQTKARKMLDYIQGRTDVIDDLVLKDGSKLNGEELAKFAEQKDIARGAQSSQLMRESNTLLPKVDKYIDDTRLLKRLSRNEETARLHHYLTQIENGMSPEDAVKSVNKYLFDYDNKSKVDRTIETFVDPFWTFHKNYAKLGLNQAVTNPSKLNNILRAEREMSNGVPEDGRNQNASESKFQAPFGSFVDEKNKDRYDYMYKQNIFPEIQNVLPLDNDSLEGKLNPLLKLAIQQARGKGDFGTNVVDKNPKFNEISKDERRKEILYGVNPFLNVLGTTKNKSDKLNKRKQSKDTTDLQRLELWLNYITGNKGKHERYLDFLE